MALTDIDELVTNCRHIITEATESFFQTAQLKAFVNQGCQQLALRLPDDCLEQLTVVDATLGTWTANAKTLPTDFLRFKMLFVTLTSVGSAEQVARLMDPQEFARMRLVTEEAPTNESPVCYVFGGKMYVEPATDAVAAQRLFYIKKPATVASGDVPFAEPYAQALVDWTCYRAFTRARETELAQIHFQSWQGMIQDVNQQYGRVVKLEERGLRGRQGPVNR